MSHTLDLLAEAEHGTVAGYQAGCHGSARSCGGTVPCAEVYRRYQGDWGFRKRVDAGDAPIDILAEELAAADAVRARDRAANRKAKAEGSKTNDARLAKQRSRSTTPRKAPELGVVARILDDVLRLVGEGNTSTQIAGILNVTKIAVTRARRVLGNPPSRKSVDRDEVTRLHGAGWNDTQIAEHLDVSNSTISDIRRNELHLPRVSTSHAPKATESARAQRARQITELHAEGKNDGEIAEALDITRSTVYQARNRLGLPLNRQTTRKPYATRTASELADLHDEPHDTRSVVIRAHGTPEGYTDGCRGRGCPKTPSCTDAILAHHRAARHAAGSAS